ncbi:hypothetical protein Taro_020765 [Colocasia esculenta]|uniref:Uncharacterized protein n=1 Tax=Colocasia esculenta TaxID=4460 RepID=A0A843UX83_COLES|nr:hypothetical protein [Colocasia esculenta]
MLHYASEGMKVTAATLNGSSDRSYMAPHVLAMSASPILRTLALALYEDMALTQISGRLLTGGTKEKKRGINQTNTEKEKQMEISPLPQPPGLGLPPAWLAVAPPPVAAVYTSSTVALAWFSHSEKGKKGGAGEEGLPPLALAPTAAAPPLQPPPLALPRCRSLLSLLLPGHLSPPPPYCKDAAAQPCCRRRRRCPLVGAAVEQEGRGRKQAACLLFLLYADLRRRYANVPAGAPLPSTIKGGGRPKLRGGGIFLKLQHRARLWDCKAITNLPPGRMPIDTHPLQGDESGFKRVHQMTQDELLAGGKVYLVFPVIEESEQLPQLHGAAADFEYISSNFRDFQCGLLLGGMKSDGKNMHFHNLELEKHAFFYRSK